MPTRERRARGILKAAIADLDPHTTLHDVDVRDELSDDDVEKLLAGKREQVENDLDESFGWEMEANNVDAYVAEVVPEEEDRELLREFDLLVHLEDEIRSRNSTSPLIVLLAHTSDPVLRFDLDHDVESVLFEEADAREGEIRGIAEAAGIDLDVNRKAIEELVDNASYGGRLQVLFSMDLEVLVEGLYGPAAQIRFTDPVLLVLDRLNGSGMATAADGIITRPLRAEDLRLDAGPYSWGDIVGGHSRGDYSTPVEITTLPTAGE